MVKGDWLILAIVIDIVWQSTMHISHGPHSWIQVFPPLVLALDAGELPKKFSVTSASTQKIAEVIKNLA